MALVAHIVPANGGRIVEKRLKAGLGKLAVADGAKVVIVDSETGAQVRAYAAETSEKGLLLKFATADGDVMLDLIGASSSFAALAADLALVADDAAQTETKAPEAATTDDQSDAKEDRAGFSPVLLGILGLGALGGIAAAAGGKGGTKEAERDVAAPAAPASLDLAAADDSGSSDSDNITKTASELTISGTTEAGAKIELFDGATSLGTTTADSSGKFTLDVALVAGVHAITAKATDAAGNVSAASAPLSITVDTTAPIAAIAMSDMALTVGETATVTVTFSEPVTGFSNADVAVGSGLLSTFVSSNGGLVWTATFTPAVDVTDLSNVIILGTGYADVAGNTGTAATSGNYTVDTVTFSIDVSNDGVVNFGGTATGPITLTLNAQDEAVFSRDGKAAPIVIGLISAKILNVPVGGELHIILDGASSSDTFTLDAPNAATMIFSGDGGSLADTLNIIIKSATDNPDLRTLKIDTSGLTGVEDIRFVFPDDARDVVKLTADSNLSGFTTIEVSKGGLDLTAITVQPGVEFIVNSTLIMTLAQFRVMTSLISVTGLGHLQINLTADEVDADALTTFLESLADKPILIGAVVTVRDGNGDLMSLPDGMDDISYPGIPEISDRIDALEARLDDLAIGDVANLSTTLAGLLSAIELLQAEVGADGDLATRLGALEVQLAGITDTVVAYINEQIAALQNDAQGEDGPSFNSIAGLRAAIEALLDGSGLGDPDTEGTIAYQLASLQAQITAIEEVLATLDSTAPTVEEVSLTSAVGADINGHLNAGDVVTATIRFSEAVLVTGSPRLLLTIGDTEDQRIVEAVLTGGAGTDTLTFSYTVDHEDIDLTGISIGANALVISNGSTITDAAGNAAVPSFAAVEDNSDFIIDNGALRLEMSARSIFGGGLDTSSVIFGLLVDDYFEVSNIIYIDDLDGGHFIVPDGFRFVTFDSYVDYLILNGFANNESEWMNDNLIESGSDVVIDFNDSVLINLVSVVGLVSRSGLVEALNTDEGQEFLSGTDFSTVDEFLDIVTYPFSFMDAAVGSTFSADFLAQIAGHDPAHVVLEVTTALTVAQATALSAAGFNLANNVDYRIGDYYTTVQAALANNDQKAALENAEQVISRGDELDNIISMTAFDWWVNLRSEMGAGNDIYNAGRGDEEIVGQHGADIINLTYLDTSVDKVVYQSVYDGRTANVVSLKYSSNDDTYLEGSTVSVWISGHQYSYTVSTGDETGHQALNNLASVVMEKQVDAAHVVIGVVYGPSPLSVTEPHLVYLDEMKDGAYTVQAGTYFLSATDYLALLTEDGGIELNTLRSMGMRGGEKFTLTSEAYLALESNYEQDTPNEKISALEGHIVLTLPSTYLAFLDGYEYLEPYCDPSAESVVEDAVRYHDVQQVTVDGTRLVFVGASFDGDLQIHGGDGADHDAIVNPGKATIAQLTFFGSEDAAYYPGLTNSENDSEFDRELRVTINGKTVTAHIVAGDPEASVAALHTALDAAMSEYATNAITAAYSTIDLRAAIALDDVLGGYTLTLMINGVSVTLSGDEDATLGDLIDAMSAIGGVQLVTLDGVHLIVTSEVRGSVAADNSISIIDLEIGGGGYDAVDTAAVAGSLYGELIAVEQEGTQLILTGTVPSDDGPSFIVDGAEIDAAGVQQLEAITFSNDDSDYYRGGSLSVIINGETYSAEMAQGEDGYSSYASLLALADAINAEAGEDADLLIERAYVGGEQGDWVLYILASVEQPDALTVRAVVQSYRGEEQTATITLEDALVYAAGLGEDAEGADRFANVYFEGGKVYATFTPRVSDGEGGLMDGSPVTISADMVLTRATSTYAADIFDMDYYIGNHGEDHFGISITIGGDIYTQTDFSAYLADLEPALSLVGSRYFDTASAATFSNLVDWLATLDGVAGVSFDPETGLTITYDAGVSGTLSPISGGAYAGEDDYSFTLDDPMAVEIDNAAGVGDPAGTAQALADAINLAASKIVHFEFTLPGGASPLTLETHLSDDSDDTKILLHTMVDGVVKFHDFIGSELPTVQTVGDLIGWLNDQYEGIGVWSLEAGGEGFALRVAATTDITVTQSLALTSVGGDVWYSVPDTVEATLGFIGHAEADGVEIIITAANVGKDTFHITDVRLDYEGVHQIATVSFDEPGYDDNDDYIRYYDGGTMSVAIDTLPGGTGGIVTVHANMVDGDRHASLQNLVDEINSYTVAGNTAAQVVMPGSPYFSEASTNGGALEAGLYISSWSVTVGVGEDSHVYQGRGEPVTVGDVTSWVNLGGLSAFDNLGDFLAYLSDLDGIVSAVLDDDGNVVITTDAQGADAYVSVSVDFGWTASEQDGDRFTTTRSDHGSSGALHGLIGHAVLGDDGTITLVSADAVREQFTIVDAELSRLPVRQEAEANFSSDSSDYYAGGKIGMTVNGITIETAMVVEAASSFYHLPNGSNFGEGNYLGSSSDVQFDVSITIDGATYDTDDFIAYLAALDTPLVLAAPDDFDPNVSATIQNLADWLQTLAGVDQVIVSAGGVKVVYEAEVHGAINGLEGMLYDGDGPSHDLAIGGLNNDEGGPDRDATLQALRDAVWQQVTHATLTIDLPEAYDLSTGIGGWSFSANLQTISSSDHDETLGGLIDGLRDLTGIESVTLVGGKIVLTAQAGVEPFLLTSNASVFAQPTMQVGGLYHAFASVEFEDDGDIYFVANNAVDGYGEINITEIFMSLAGKAQITAVDFGNAEFATGLSDGNDDRADVSLTINGQTVTTKTQGNHNDTVRAVAQAIIEARDGVFAQDVVSIGQGNFAAVVRLDVPGDADGDTRLVKDGVGNDSSVAISLAFSIGGPTFSYVSANTYNMTIKEFVADLNSQIQSWAIQNELDQGNIGVASYDDAANQIVFKSYATGADSYVNVTTANISGLWQAGSENVQDEGSDSVLSYYQDGTLAISSSIRIDVSTGDGVFFTAGDDGAFTIDGEDYNETVLSHFNEGAWDQQIRFEMHLSLTPDDPNGTPVYWDYYSGVNDYPSWLSPTDMTSAFGSDAEITLSDIVAALNAAFTIAHGPIATILLDAVTGQIVVTPADGYSVALGGEDRGIGNDLRIEIGTNAGVVLNSLIVNDEVGIRVNIGDDYFKSGADQTIDGEDYGFETLSTNIGEDQWSNSLSGYLYLDVESITGSHNFGISFGNQNLNEIYAGGGAGDAITIRDIVRYLNNELAEFGADYFGDAGAVSISIVNGQIVITAREDFSVSFAEEYEDAGLHIEVGGNFSEITAYGSYNLNGSIVQDGVSDGDATIIDLPAGVTAGSMIHGVPGGHFFGEEASTDIHVTFTISGENLEFIAPTDLDKDMTVLDFVTGLNAQLTAFEVEQAVGNLGTFSFDAANGQIVFTPAHNALLSSYQIYAFDISAFIELTELLDDGASSHIIATEESDRGESGLLVMHSASRAISVGDPISMDVVHVTFTIDDVALSRDYYPALNENVGEVTTVGHFLEWVERTFTGVHAAIVDGDIVFTGDFLEGAEVALQLLESSEVISSAAAVGTAVTGGGAGASLTLADYAGMDGDTVLLGDHVDFQIFVGGATGGLIIDFSYEIGVGSTVDDLLDYIESYATTQTGDNAYLSATLTQGGIVLSVNGEAGVDHLWVSALSLTVEQERTGIVAEIAAALGQVTYNGEDSIILHGKDVGADHLQVGGISYETVDEDNSALQQVVVEFSNSKLDNVTDGSIISLSVAGITAAITVSLDGSPNQGDLDLSATPAAGHSTAILAALTARLLDYDLDGKIGSIDRGRLNGDGAFVLDSANDAVVLRIDAGHYGSAALGVAANIEAKIVNAGHVEQFSVIADETRAGSIAFLSSSDGVDIYDESGEGHGAQTGRNEQIITYHDGNGGEDSDGSYTIKDATATGPGVTLSDDDAEDYDYLDIDDDETIGVGPGSIDQDFVNPGASGSGYHGGTAQSGEDGIRQTVRNPDGSYSTIDNSPAANGGNQSTGNGDLYGGASGYYDGDGLHTDHLDGATVVEGEDYYTPIKTGTTTNVTGAYHGEVTDGDNGEDAFHGDIIDDGFAGFTWDHVIKSTVAASSNGPDVINHFQVDKDQIVFEGSLERSTVAGWTDWEVASGGTGGDHFDLDRDEFGIVDGIIGDVGVEQLSNASAIANLLERAFDFNSYGEDGEINTSIFAVNAADDHTTTAIWVHTQSSYGDYTVDANELTLLAIVHTTGGTFNSYNLHTTNDHFPPV